MLFVWLFLQLERGRQGRNQVAALTPAPTLTLVLTLVWLFRQLEWEGGVAMWCGVACGGSRKGVNAICTCMVFEPNSYRYAFQQTNIQCVCIIRLLCESVYTPIRTSECSEHKCDQDVNQHHYSMKNVQIVNIHPIYGSNRIPFFLLPAGTQAG